jgi:hypothetical protein
MANEKQLGTIQETTMFGPDYKHGAGTPSAAAASSGLRQADNSSAYWLVGLIGILLVVRLVWERAT